MRRRQDPPYPPNGFAINCTSDARMLKLWKLAGGGHGGADEEKLGAEERE